MLAVMHTHLFCTVHTHFVLCLTVFSSFGKDLSGAIRQPSSENQNWMSRRNPCWILTACLHLGCRLTTFLQLLFHVNMTHRFARCSLCLTIFAPISDTPQVHTFFPHRFYSFNTCNDISSSELSK